MTTKINTANETRQALIDAAEHFVKEESIGHPELKALKTGKAGTNAISDHVDRFVKEEESKGYSREDLSFRGYVSTHGAWYSWLGCRVVNVHTNRSCKDGKVRFPKREDLDKDLLLPALQEEKQALAERKIKELEQTIKALRDENNHLLETIQEMEEEEV